MPLLSIFTPCGMLEMSSADPPGQKFYEGLIAGYGGDKDAGVQTAYLQFTPESETGIPNPQEADVYATAMALARAQNAVVRAGNQYNPQTAWDLILQQAADWGVVPSPNDTVVALQGKIAAKQFLAQGAEAQAMYAGLRAVIGTNFLSYRTLQPTEITVYPTWPSATARVKANPTLPLPTTKFCQLVDPVAGSGSQTITYTNLDALAGDVDLIVGDVVMVQPENTALSERVIVTATTMPEFWVASIVYALGDVVLPTSATGYWYEVTMSGVAGTTEPAYPTAIGSVVADGTATLECMGLLPGPRTFTASFVNSHDPGATVTTMSWPYWWSTQNLALVVVPASVANDADTRRLVNGFLQDAARETNLWAIVQPSSTDAGGGILGPFALDASPIGCVPLGTLAYLNSP